MRTTFGPTLKLIHQVLKKRGLLSVRACFRAMLILPNLPGHIELLRVLAAPPIADLVRRHPRLGYRYLIPYLAHNLSRKSRLTILTNHYRKLKDRLNENALVQIYEDSPVLWKECLGDQTLRITLSFPQEHDYEGDLRLDFKSGDVTLYAMTFTIAPGQALHVDSDQVLLISAIQGASGKVDLLRQITKICHGTSPLYLLLAAVEAVALSLGIGMLVGVGREQQIARRRGENAIRFFDYDGFWSDVSAEKTSGDFYRTPVPFPEKPIELLKSNRRSRALRRRELRNRISEQVQVRFTQRLLKRAE